jgi:F-type H+-transporting ATPase subunit alpha
MPVEEQVISIYAGTSGALDDIPTDAVRRFEDELLGWMRSRHAGLLSEIRDTGAMPEGGAVESAVDAFKAEFVAGLGEAASAGVADPTATDAEAVGEAESHKTLETE